jgi:hypothetical protein
MRVLLVAVVVVACVGGCEPMPGDADSASEDAAPVLCSANPDPVCDDGDPCTFDICDVTFFCGYDDCPPEGPRICWHLELDADTDGFHSGTDGCGWDDCDDSDSTVRPGWPEDCADGKDNDCDGLTDCADDSCSCP